MRRRRPKGLILIGAGGLGREVVELVRALNARRHTWELLGFLDDEAALRGTRVAGLPVLGPVDSITRWPGISVAVCTARPIQGASRRQVVDRLGLPPEARPPLIHPDASVAETSSLGAGTILLAQVVCTADVTLGEHVVAMPQVVFTHDVVVGDHVTIGAGATLAGGVSVGEGAYLGAGSHVRQHATIGAGALVGMASTVLGHVPPDETWAGTPARPLGSGAHTNGGHRRPRRDQAEAS